jgi:hypothetical protein
MYVQFKLGKTHLLFSELSGVLLKMLCPLFWPLELRVLIALFLNFYTGISLINIAQQNKLSFDTTFIFQKNMIQEKGMFQIIFFSI